MNTCSDGVRPGDSLRTSAVLMHGVMGGPHVPTIAPWRLTVTAAMRRPMSGGRLSLPLSILEVFGSKRPALGGVASGRVRGETPAHLLHAGVDVLEPYLTADDKARLAGWDQFKATSRGGHVSYNKGQRKDQRRLYTETADTTPSG
jgi:hypothetical protein